MSSDWSREVSPPQPVLAWAVLIAALLFPAVLLTLAVESLWTPLQRTYLLTYAFTLRGGSDQYRLLAVTYPNNRKLLASDDDVASAEPPPGILRSHQSCPQERRPKPRMAVQRIR